MRKKNMFYLFAIALLLFMSCESSPSSSFYVSYDDLYPTLSKARSFLENNNIESAKNTMTNASSRDRLTILYAICAKQIRGFNYRNNTKDFILFLISRNVDVNETDTGEFPAGPKLSYGYRKDLTALMQASSSGNYEAVQVLIDNGAKVNLRDKDGATALSKAYDKGEMEIYNYLVEHGAIEFAPRQVAQQPSAPAPSPTTVIVQPSAPVQTTPTPSTPTAYTLRGGTYGLTGTKATISIASVGRAGIINYVTTDGKNGIGSYGIEGNRMTISMEGYTFIYTITSETSFSGNGETWVRTGY